MAKPRERRWDPAELALRGRIGAHILHARYDSRALTANARAAFLASFERAVDPEGQLPAEERRRRAAHLRSAHFARLARLSALARRKRAGRRGNIGARSVVTHGPPPGEGAARDAATGPDARTWRKVRRRES